MPPIYVINLDRDVERMASLARSLEALALPFERVSAVLGKQVPDWEKLVDAGLYSARNRLPIPRPGEVGHARPPGTSTPPTWPTATSTHSQKR